MEAREYLEQVNKLKKKIESLKKLSDYYDRMSYSLPGQDFTRERVDHTPSYDAPFVKWIYKKIETDDLIAKLEKDLVVLKDEVSTAIDKMENIDYKNVLYLRYIEGLLWEDIGAKIYASERTARRYHNAALKEFVP